MFDCCIIGCILVIYELWIVFFCGDDSGSGSSGSGMTVGGVSMDVKVWWEVVSIILDKALCRPSCDYCILQ